jgi:hypothetical protein
MSAFLNALREEGTFDDIAYFLKKPEYKDVEEELLEMTEKFDEHPDDYDGPCRCKTCLSYGD